MKILQLRFKNINSLVGEWQVDFTEPAYAADGIFAITGPTGSGKSSILDAICLALFGKTPRLPIISASSNEIMSRQTGDCFAEVKFSTQSGNYRCHWEQHKARGAVDGKLSQPKHEISEAQEGGQGKILASKVREVAQVVEEKTGMDFDRFTRSVLLAQGSFAAFLNANPDERSPVLEQITGAEIYTNISLHVHECFAREKAQLDLLKAESSGIQFLSEEEVKMLTVAAAAQVTGEKLLVDRNNTVAQAIQWCKTIASLEQEILMLDQAALTIAGDLQSFEPQRQKLARALQATELEGLHAQLVSLRTAQQNELAALAGSEKQRVVSEQALAESEIELKSNEEKLNVAKEAQKAELTVIKRVRNLDGQLIEHDRGVKKIGEEVQTLTNRSNAENEKRAASVKHQSQAVNKRIGAEKYLIENSGDAALVSDFTGIKEQMQSLRALVTLKASLAKDAEQCKNRLQADQKKLENQKIDSEGRQAAFVEAQSRVKSTVEALARLLDGRALREYRGDRESLTRELLLLNKIVSLEAERQALEDGRPCPLCGALEHPFAAGNVPEAGETDKKLKKLENFINEAENLEEQAKSLAVHEKAAQELVIAGDKKLEELKFKVSETQTQLNIYQDELQKLILQSVDLETLLSKRISPYGISKLTDADIDTTLEILSRRLAGWQKYDKERAEIDMQIVAFDADVKTSESLLAAITTDLNHKQSVMTAAVISAEALRAERQALYGVKDADIEERCCEEAVEAAERQVTAGRERRDVCSKQYQEHSNRIASWQESTGRRVGEIAISTQEFTQSLAQAGFADEADFVICRLSREEREALARSAKELERRQQELSARQTDVKNKLTAELAKKITTESLAVLNVEQEKLTSELKKIAEEIGALKQKLADNEKARSRAREKLAMIDAQTVEFNRWAALHRLIGSSDGKKFRNFAQGLTFAIVVAHANQQLARMTDRYLLKRDETQPLELMVIDNYQAGEVRSTKNLSGGESFIVSLSLALGLSSMASRNVRVDSLFLDEGFGTLDEEALESALEALAGLHQEGKLIGIISHVPAIKERINLQINVCPQTSGRSVMSGPGCSRK